MVETLKIWPAVDIISPNFFSLVSINPYLPQKFVAIFNREFWTVIYFSGQVIKHNFFSGIQEHLIGMQDEDITDWSVFDFPDRAR